MKCSIINTTLFTGLFISLSLLGCTQSSPENYLKNGDELYKQKQYDKAIVEYDKAVGLKKDFVLAYINKGAALEFQRKFDEAIKNYNIILKILPDQPAVLTRRGIAYIGIQKIETGLADLQLANSISPNNPIILCNLGLCKISLKDSSGISDLNKSILLDSSSHTAYYNRGLGKLLTSDYEAAIQDFAKSIHLKPNYGEGLCGIGIAKFQLGDKEAACRYWKLSIDAGYQRAQLLIDNNCN